MGILIRKITIENFRSIRRLNLDVQNLSVLVGKNDCGKSNILRALNLFFNNQTNPGTPFNFREDFSLAYVRVEKKAPQIVVQIEFEIPQSYRATNGDILIWKKRWRADGMLDDGYYGIRLKGPEKNIREKVEIPEKSNLHSLLKKIEFQYIPAIKDAHYFDTLRGKIYGIISEVAAATFLKSSSAFETAIANHLVDLTTDITNALHFDTKLALPRDLSHIFERLDFVSGASSVSLDARGDGIKARHIPLILKFMAEKKSSLQTRGAMPYSFIWGYEEPENNLELSSCVALADTFAEYSTSNVAQILLTTHSPVFFNLSAREDAKESTICHHVFLETPESGTMADSSARDLDEKMGTMTLLAPQIQAIEDKVRDRERAKLLAEQASNENKAKIFVEGTTDKLLIEKAIRVFQPGIEQLVSIETKSPGGGHSYVIDHLTGWRSVQKHNPGLPKAVGVLDKDQPGASAKKTWNSEPNNTQSCKCFCYDTPTHIIPVLRANWQLPITLETLYPKSIWEYALARHYLEPRKLIEILPDNITEDLINENKTAEDYMDKDWEIFVKYKFKEKGKSLIANHIVRKSDDDFANLCPAFLPLVNQIQQYLFQ
ncbi:ATP-dependent endonuclease [Kordiimonas lipolytica]|uniref:ATP-dependent endonuclease n=1 Tax=Kordiimonas lipolytica TaxID=1662421 RepID=A0ABV8UF72_9PROT|nr:AAA family ATPase [Kordiimonas lipolytica]